MDLKIGFVMYNQYQIDREVTESERILLNTTYGAILHGTAFKWRLIKFGDIYPPVIRWVILSFVKIIISDIL